MLSNTDVLAKFRFDTAENEPTKNLQNFPKKIANFANSRDPKPYPRRRTASRRPPAAGPRTPGPPRSASPRGEPSGDAEPAAQAVCLVGGSGKL